MKIRDVYGLGMYIFRLNSPAKSIHFWYVEIGETVKNLTKPFVKKNGTIWSKKELKEFTRYIAHETYEFWKKTGLKKMREKDKDGKSTKKVIWVKQ